MLCENDCEAKFSVANCKMFSLKYQLQTADMQSKTGGGEALGTYQQVYIGGVYGQAEISV